MSKNKKDILIIVTICILVILVIACFLFLKERGKEKDTFNDEVSNIEQEQVPVEILEKSHIILSINPKVLLEIDNKNKILEVYPLNEEALIFNSQELIGLNFEKEGINKIIEIAEKNGYLKEEKEISLSIYEGETNQIIDSIISDLEARGYKIEKDILTKDEQKDIEKELEEMTLKINDELKNSEEKNEEKPKQEENKTNTTNKKPINTEKENNNNPSNNQSSTSEEPTNTVNQLNKPENVKWDESKIGLVTWSPVQYAAEYSVEIFKDGTSIGAGGSPETSCEIIELIKQHGAGTYTIKIKAHSNELFASDEVTTTYTVQQLSKPQNVKWSESKIGLVTWSPVQYADEYSVEIFKDGTSIGAGGSPETSCEITELIKQHGAGTYTIKIKAHSSILPTSDETATTYIAKQLSKPQNIKWSESEVGLVTWSPVQYADEYSVEIFKDGTSIGAGGSPETCCEIKELIKQCGAGTYTVKIKAHSSILPTSDETATTYIAKQLSKPQNLKWSESKIGLVTWSPVQYADEYSVEIFKDGTSIGAGGSPEPSCEIKGLIDQFGAGTYTVKIKAYSNVLQSSDEVTTSYTI